MRLKSLWNPAFWLVPAMVLLIFLLQVTRWVDFHEADALDWRFRLRGAVPAHEDIVLVTVDDASLADFGKWPWPRSLHAAFLDLVSRVNPKLVFFDVLFMEESPDAAEDGKLRLSLRNAGNVLLPFFYTSEKPFQAVFPTPKLREVARDIAYANLMTDDDGHVRRFKTHIRAENEFFFHPAVQAAYLGLKPIEKINRLRQIAPHQGNEMWINYPGSMNSFQHISFSEVIKAAGLNQEARLRELFEGKIILLGHTATGTGMIDIKSTPFSPEDPGVLIVASAMHTLLTNRILFSTHPIVDLLLFSLLALLISFVTMRISPLAAFLTTVGVALIFGVVNYLIFILTGWIMPLVGPELVLGLSYVATLYIKHMEVCFQREIVERERQAASQIQQNFLPATSPESKGLAVAFECRFTKGVGGDLYDWVDLGDGRYGFSVGDVSGKGMPAAIYMAKSVSDFRSIHKNDKSPGEVCTELNRVLTAAGVTNMFLTLFYAVVDLKQQKMTYCNGGHEPALFVRQGSDSVEVLEGSQGLPLGMFEDTEYATDEISIHDGDTMLLFTDGVNELRNTKREEYGIERIKSAFLSELKNDPDPSEIIKKLFRHMQLHQGKLTAHDDRTLLVLRRLKDQTPADA